MLKRTKVEINKKVLDILYQKEKVLEGELFHGKVFFGKNVLQFSVLKRKDGATLFEPNINEQNQLLVIRAIENNERKIA